jgi:hypothetical protein
MAAFGNFASAQDALRSGLSQALKSTPAKTPVPTRTVLPPKKGKPKPTVALTPTQVANQQVAQLLAPQYDQQKQAAQAQNDAITNFTRQLVAQLQGTAPHVADSYNQAIGQQTNLSNAAADSLRAANPNTQDQALLSAINAPDAQHAALAGSNNAAFNGGAAVGQYLGGVLPMGALQAEKQAAVTQAYLQPGFEGLRGQQALAGALYQQGQDRSKIAAQQPQLAQQFLSDQATASARQQQLQLERDVYGLNTAKAKASTNLAQQRITNQQNQFIAKYNQQQAKTNADATKPNASLSRAAGVLVDSQGNPILKNGKQVVLPGFKVGKNGNVVKTTTPKAPGSVKPIDPYKHLSTKQVSVLRSTAAEALNGTVFHGKHPTDTITIQGHVYKDGDTISPLPYTVAFKWLRDQGFSRQAAYAALNEYYPKGKQGRPGTPAQNAADAKKVARDRKRGGKSSTGLGIAIQPPA